MAAIDELRQETVDGQGPVEKKTSSRLDKTRHDLLTEDPVVRRTVADSVLDGVLAAGNGLLSLLAGLLATILIVYSGYVLIDTFGLQYRASHTSWDLLQYKPEIINDYSTPLASSQITAINSDYRAWLTIFDTNIDYPVVQGEDDLYYASHDIYKQNSLTGAIYLAAANSPDFSDSYSLIYGHHMDGDIMFGSLDQFREESFFQSHKSALLVTLGGTFDVTFFAVAETDAYESNVYSVGNKLDQVLNFLKQNRVDNGGTGGGGVGVGTKAWFYGGVPENPRKIIALSTCASANTNGRLVVFGIMSPRISAEAVGYFGIYDGRPHTLEKVFGRYGETILNDVPVEYFDENDSSWKPWDETAEAVNITNVGTKTIRLRVTSELYGTAETSVVLTVVPRTVILTSASAAKYYDGTPLIRNAQSDITVTGDGFVEGEGAVYTFTGSRTEIGSGRNTFTYTLLEGTDPANYNIIIVEGTLTVYRRSTSEIIRPNNPVNPDNPAQPVVTNPAERTVTVDAVDTPLGLGAVNINIGDCIE